MGNYQVAGIRLCLKGMDYPLIKRRMKAYESESTDADITVSLETKETVEKPEGEYVALLEGFRHWLRTKEGYANFDLPSDSEIPVGSLRAKSDWSRVDLVMRDISMINPEGTYEVRAFAMLSHMMSAASLFHDALVVHASSIAVDEKYGILFSARSGTGKSTHTSLWKKFYPNRVEYINDDQPIVRFKDGKPWVYGTPWSGKTEINQNISVPLRAIVFLEQSKTNEIRPLDKKEAIGHLINEVRKSVFPELMFKTLALVDGIIKEIPTYRLKCDISKEAVDTVQKELGLYQNA